MSLNKALAKLFIKDPFHVFFFFNFPLYHYREVRGFGSFYGPHIGTWAQLEVLP